MVSSKRLSKYHLSINFLAEKRLYFPSPKSSKQELFQLSVNIIFTSTLWLKNTIFYPSKLFKHDIPIFHAKENIILSFFFMGLKHHSPPPPIPIPRILTETHTNDHTPHTKNNWLGPIATQKECFFGFIWVCKVWLRLTPIQRGGLCPLRLLTLMIEFCLCPSGEKHQRTDGYGGVFLKDCKLICKMKMMEMKTK